MITITTDISTALNAGFSPLYVIAETDRFELEKTEMAITALSVPTGLLGGFLKITIATGSAIATGDSILVYGATGNREKFNGRYNVDSIPTAGILKTDTGFILGATSGGYGTAQRLNENLTLRMDLSDVTNATAFVGEMYAYPVSYDGDLKFIWDISKMTQNFASNFTITTGYTELAGHSRAYIADITETFQDKDYDATDHDEADVYAAATFYSLRSADISDRVLIATGSSLCHGYSEAWIRRDVKLPVCFITDNLVDTHTILIDGATAITDLCAGRVMLGMVDVSAMSGRNSVAVHIATGGTYTSETLYVNIDDKCYHNAKTFYFLNRYGGYDWYDFLSCQEEQQAEKIPFSRKPSLIEDPRKMDYIKSTHQRMRCLGRAAPRRMAEFIRDLIGSPEVWDEDGEAVRVVTSSVQTYGDEIIPEITVEYNNARCIKFQ